LEQVPTTLEPISPSAAPISEADVPTPFPSFSTSTPSSYPTPIANFLPSIDIPVVPLPPTSQPVAAEELLPIFPGKSSKSKPKTYKPEFIPLPPAPPTEGQSQSSAKSSKAHYSKSNKSGKGSKTWTWTKEEQIRYKTSELENRNSGVSAMTGVALMTTLLSIFLFCIR